MSDFPQSHSELLDSTSQPSPRSGVTPILSVVVTIEPVSIYAIDMSG